MNKKKNLEQGQITILFLFAVVALFGFAALSIDGGRLYFQQRAAQSTADDAAMTGALAIANGYSSSEVQTIVLNRTKSNDFDDALDEVSVEVHWPPIAPNAYAGDMEYIQVFITSDSPKYFSQFVFQGDLQVTVEAIAHVRPSGGIFSGYAILGTNPHDCKTVEFHGNPEVEVTGGGSIGSNSDAGCSCGSLVSSGNFTIDVDDDGEITAVGCWRNNGSSGAINPTPITGVAPLDVEKMKELIPIPECSGQPNHGSVSAKGSETLTPGYYESMKFNSKADVTLEPGLYCIYGSGKHSIQINAGARVVGHGVTFYMMTTSGGWKINGGAYVELDAPRNLVDPRGNQWEGMLIYTHPDNTSEIHLSGGSNSYFEGSIYALGSHCALLGGGSGIGFQTSVYCDTVEIGGNGDLDIMYNEDLNYKMLGSLDLSK